MMKVAPARQIKDSGISWIGDVPSEWELVRNKYLFSEVEDKTDTGEGQLLSLTRLRGLIPQEEVNARGSTASSLVGYRVCSPGDIVMNRMQAWTGMFGLASTSGLVSPDYVILRARQDLNPEYMLLQLKLPGMVWEFHRASKGVGEGFLRLYWREFGDVRSLVPSRAEQDSIVQYVGRLTSEIDAMHAVVERLVGKGTAASRQGSLLLDYQLAVSHAAITGKIDTRGSGHANGHV